MSHVAEANDYRLATDGAVEVAAWRQHILEVYGAKALQNYDAGCRCWMFRPDPMCPVHNPLEEVSNGE